MSREHRTKYPKIEFFVRSLRNHCQSPCWNGIPPETCGCLFCHCAKLLQQLATPAPPKDNRRCDHINSWFVDSCGECGKELKRRSKKVPAAHIEGKDQPVAWRWRRIDWITDLPERRQWEYWYPGDPAHHDPRRPDFNERDDIEVQAVFTSSPEVTDEMVRALELTWKALESGDDEIGTTLVGVKWLLDLNYAVAHLRAALQGEG